jgi:hypothetical protein
MVPRQGRDRCPVQKALGNRCTVSRYHLYHLYPLYHQGRENRRSLLQAACGRPTADFVQHAVDRRRLNAKLAQAGEVRGRV